ncbi:small nuclear ribonucleoprotein [Caldisphaera lagunensis DSM 15908]|uniref:Small nuclear ribonucleoprotein n=1 Tax=Caldisphaera lagunensis (strain DSM 15908 / JCM 11604 / ANMR 0165 / IC-154) TaxID=1056495 RepID=L0AD38_CALLD|nr:Lsm family RNA-binding protein [Caldisphaera lagunensis]AFZ70965.1 small nuclear ribonucleoprotein [Caldisphaera lagunensis DSM 15908]
MSASPEPARRFVSRLNSLLDRNVTIKLINGRTYTGKLTGYDPTTYSIMLESAKDNEGNIWPLSIIYGNNISEILMGESEIFNAKEFSEFLSRFGNIEKHLIKVYDDINVVEVGKSIKVSKDGVEGSGPLAQKIYSIYREYLRTKGINQ